MKDLTERMILNGLGIMKLYLPNLFEYISDKDFEKYLRGAFKYSKDNQDAIINNFSISFLSLVKEHKLNKSFVVRNEFGYFNYLIGQAYQFENVKEFKSLIISSINNPVSNNFKHILGEIAACIDINDNLKFIKYEKKLENGKSIDFHFHSENNDLYVDVLNIDIDSAKYEKESFQKFLNQRLLQKFENKSNLLTVEIKNQIIVFPILYGLTAKIIHEQAEYLKSIQYTKFDKDKFQSYSPKCFGNIQGTFFKLFSIDELVNSKIL